MLVAFTFRARPGQAKALRDLLDAPDAARHAARGLGASRNILLVHGDRFVRVFEFPDGTRPLSLAELARRDPQVHDFLRRIGRLTEPAYDPDDPETLEAFSKGATMDLVLDVHA